MEERLRNIWMRRARAVQAVYPNRNERRRIYKASLTPRSASSLIRQADALRTYLIAGAVYAGLTTDEKLAFIADVLGLLSAIPVFRVRTNLGRSRNFRDWQQS